MRREASGFAGRLVSDFLLENDQEGRGKHVGGEISIEAHGRHTGNGA
jgi:hypothetical protein